MRILHTTSRVLLVAAALALAGCSPLRSGDPLARAAALGPETDPAVVRTMALQDPAPSVRARATGLLTDHPTLSAIASNRKEWPTVRRAAINKVTDVGFLRQLSHGEHNEREAREAQAFALLRLAELGDPHALADALHTSPGLRRDFYPACLAPAKMRTTADLLRFNEKAGPLLLPPRRDLLLQLTKIRQAVDDLGSPGRLVFRVICRLELENYREVGDPLKLNHGWDKETVEVQVFVAGAAGSPLVRERWTSNLPSTITTSRSTPSLEYPVIIDVGTLLAQLAQRVRGR